MKCIYFPYPGSKNEYMEQMMESISVARKDVEWLPLVRKCISDADIIWLNWFESFYTDSSYKYFKLLIQRIFYIYYIKSKKKKIIFTLHNRLPHDSVHKSISLSFMRFAMRHSDRIAVLNRESIELAGNICRRDIRNKCSLILHPLFRTTPKIPSENTHPFRVLFFGLLKPYKNIEMLIELARENSDIFYTISGSPVSFEYGERLKKSVRGLRNVILELKYNSHDEIEHLIDCSDIVALPYDIRSSLNSGVAVYAFSKGINVVIPRIGTVSELHTCNDIFSYRYQNDGQHKAAFKEKLYEAYTLFRQDINTYNGRADAVRKEVLDRCSIGAVAEQISEMFTLLGL